MIIKGSFEIKIKCRFDITGIGFSFSELEDTKLNFEGQHHPGKFAFGFIFQFSKLQLISTDLVMPETINN